MLGESEVGRDHVVTEQFRQPVQPLGCDVGSQGTHGDEPLEATRLEQATLADKELASIRKARSTESQYTHLPPHKPLLGIPLAVKDVLTVEGLPCTAGSKILEGFIP
ncbi:MAG: amidase family protein, partial [Deltaproteobacteria bacterium]|nr:amidase family protein [Deltaproteobacteria bacterium]